MDHIREVPIGATETIRIVCKETIAELGNNIYQYGTQDQGDKAYQNNRGDSRLSRKRA
jgi:hypothetical protein